MVSLHMTYDHPGGGCHDDGHYRQPGKKLRAEPEVTARGGSISIGWIRTDFAHRSVVCWWFIGLAQRNGDSP